MPAAGQSENQSDIRSAHAIDSVAMVQKGKRHDNKTSRCLFHEFAADGDGNLMAFESRTGKNLWHYQMGYQMRSTSGTTYMLDGRQYLLVPAGSALTAFALPPR